MSKELPRDTQFAGFARLLAGDCARLPIDLKESAEEANARFQLLLAQRAYDLVWHATQYTVAFQHPLADRRDWRSSALLVVAMELAAFSILWRIVGTGGLQISDIRSTMLAFQHPLADRRDWRVIMRRVKPLNWSNCSVKHRDGKQMMSGFIGRSQN